LTRKRVLNGSWRPLLVVIHQVGGIEAVRKEAMRPKLREFFLEWGSTALIREQSEALEPGIHISKLEI
jgi:hypothetical protein